MVRHLATALAGVLFKASKMLSQEQIKQMERSCCISLPIRLNTIPLNWLRPWLSRS